MQVEVTAKCNHRCTICPRDHGRENGEADLLHMDEEIFLDLAGNFYLTRMVHLQGWGEPLLHPSILSMLETAKKAGIQVSFTTNGSLLGPDLCKDIIRLGVDTVGISLAGTTPKSHEFIRRGSHYEQVLNNITALTELKKECRSMKPKVVLSYLLMNSNRDELIDLPDIALQVGAEEVVVINLDCVFSGYQDREKAFSCEKEPALTKKIITASRNKARDLKLRWRDYPLVINEALTCELDPTRIIYVSSAGLVSPCVYLNIPGYDPITRIFCGEEHVIEPLSFGNIGESGMKDIWQNEEYVKFRSAHENRKDVGQDCLARQFDLFDFPGSVRCRNGDGEKELKGFLKDYPYPEACRSCYKAYGI